MSHIHYQVRGGLHFTTLRKGQAWKCPTCDQRISVTPCVFCLAEKARLAALAAERSQPHGGSHG